MKRIFCYLVSLLWFITLYFLCINIRIIDLNFENELENNKYNKHDDNICKMDIEANDKIFNFENSSTNWIWNTLLPQIIQISKHSDDKNYNWKRFTVELLRTITPNLENCVQNLPTLQWSKIEELIEIAFSRYQYIHGLREFKEEPRTINIVILGGSVTKGVNCAAYPKHNITPNFAIMKCNWYSRLNRMVFEIFGSKNGVGLFHIESIAMGGTNTAIGTEAVKYNLLSTTDKVFDIIINAYSTNDVHVDTIKEANEKNLTLEENLFQMEQEFIRTSLGENKPCKQKSLPLVIYYNDYIGNEQKGIIELDSFSSVMRKLTSYYGIGHLSYVDVVRHFVYADSSETWFSPDMWPGRNVHPGRGFHIITPWLFLYYGINLISSYCNKKDVEDIFEGYSNSIKFGYSPKLPSRGQGIPKTILPLLDKNLNLDTISSKWNNITSLPRLCSSEETTYCRLSFIGSLPGALNQRQLGRLMKKFVTFNDGWEIVMEKGGKVGIKAMKKKASLKFAISQTSENVHPISVITFFTLKSYGHDWKDSRLKIFLKREVPQDSEVIEISGEHDKKTSETYKYKFDLQKQIDHDEHFTVEMELMTGSTFKLIGMTFCSF